MSAAVTARLLVIVPLVAFLAASASGQPASTKPVQRKSPGKAAGKTTVPAKLPAAAPADVTIRTKYTSAAQVAENTTYVKGDRVRVEFPGVVSIEQCDLGQALLINPAAKTYLIVKHGQAGASGSLAPAASVDQDTARVGPAKSPGGGVVTYTTTLSDTGERRQMFGREARHVTTTTTKAASESACNQTPVTVEVDGWYVDFPPIGGCSAPGARALATAASDGCADQVESRTEGDAKLGFPVAMRTTTKTGEGDRQEVGTSSMEVTLFDVTTLDAALFTAPAGYAEVKSSAELTASFQGGRTGLSDALLGSTADGSSSAAPKEAGAVRIGVLEPVDKTTRGLSTGQLREQLASRLRSAPYEAITLPGNSVPDGQVQASRMECDYLLYTEIADISTSKPGKAGGMLKRVSGQGPAREVHEARLEFRLYRVGAEVASPAFSDTARASSGGPRFGIRSALNLFIYAGSMYVRFTSLGLLGPSLMASLGNRRGLAGRALFDPRATAMSSVFQVLGSETDGHAAATRPGSADVEVEIRRTVDAATANVAKETIDHLKKNGRK